MYVWEDVERRRTSERLMRNAVDAFQDSIAKIWWALGLLEAYFKAPATVFRLRRLILEFCRFRVLNIYFKSKGDFGRLLFIPLRLAHNLAHFHSGPSSPLGHDPPPPPFVSIYTSFVHTYRSTSTSTVHIRSTYGTFVGIWNHQHPHLKSRLSIVGFVISTAITLSLYSWDFPSTTSLRFDVSFTSACSLSRKIRDDEWEKTKECLGRSAPTLVIKLLRYHGTSLKDTRRFTDRFSYLFSVSV